VLAAGLLPPSALTLREDLRTRLGWGQVLALELLTEAQTREVLRQAAKARGLALSEEVMDFTLRRFSRDLGHLMQLLDTLDRYALQTQRALTIPLVKSMLEIFLTRRTLKKELALLLLLERFRLGIPHFITYARSGERTKKKTRYLEYP
jgi:chromosomal replication initiation ATPase DnaA